MSIVELFGSEPRWWAIVGLSLDLVGGSLVAWTAWLRLKFPGKTGVGVGGGLTYTPAIEEEPDTLRRRRIAVAVGGSLLGAGFTLQILSNWLQIGRSVGG